MLGTKVHGEERESAKGEMEMGLGQACISIERPPPSLSLSGQVSSLSHPTPKKEEPSPICEHTTLLTNQII